MDVHHQAPEAKPVPGQPSHGEIKLQPDDANLDDEASESDNDKPKSVPPAINSSADRKKENGEEKMKYLMEKKKKKEGEVNLSPYKELWKAVKSENWEHVRNQLDKDPGALMYPVTEFYETILHILVKWKKAVWLAKEIVEKVDSSSLEKTDYLGDTALSVAASVGKTEAAEMMAKKNPKLLMKFNSRKESPFHVAVKFGHEKTFNCLLCVARTSLEIDDINEKVFSGSSGAKIVDYLLSANLYGLALHMLDSYRQLGGELWNRKKILEHLAKKPLSFESGYNFGPWGRLIYKVKKSFTIPCTETKIDDCCLRINISNVDEDRDPTKRDGIKNSIDHFFQNCRRIASKFPLISLIQNINETKLKNDQAREIVQLMCNGVDWTFHDASQTLKDAALEAAKLGIAEIVEEILKAYPAATRFYDGKNLTILELAVVHRRYKVFNLFSKRYLSQKWGPTCYPIKGKENLLHLAGRCLPSRHISGAAMQMQLEMQWFKAVENMVHPLLKEERNGDNKTPREVFEEKHKKLMKDGEKWMRDTASSCMVVDALIIAMVFAAIIAVPGNNEKGIPNFRNESLFKVFTVADAAALFSSSFSLLLFVRILTTRYDVEDFLKALPRRLLFGLITLIFSIAAMLVASSSALIMLMDAVPGPKVMLRRSTVIPVTILATLPVVFFIWSQSRLLIEVFLSTYRPAIFFVREDDD